MKIINDSSFQKKGFDYRLIIIGLLIVCFLILLFSEFSYGSYVVLGKYLGINPIPYFIDLKILLCGIDAIRLEEDPYKAICVDGKPFFNYPIIWGTFSIFPFLTVKNTVYIGGIIAVSFISSVYLFIGKLKFFDAIIYSCFLLSPAVLLGIERGNCDLVIFLFVLLAMYVGQKKQLFFTILIFTASVLKIFPIAALIGIFFLRSKDSFKKSVIIFGIAISLFVIYFLAYRQNFLIVSQTTPRPFAGQSYGLGSIPGFLSSKFPIIRSFAYPTFLCILMTCFYFFYKFYTKIFDRFSIVKEPIGLQFIIGNSIFLLTCFIGFNAEYRLVFLLLCVPQLLQWYKVETIKYANYLLFGTIFITWQSFFSDVLRIPMYHYFNQLIVVIMFFSYLAILIKVFFKYININKIK